MKLSKLLLCVLVGSWLFATSAESAVVVLDSFSEGAFSLKFSGPTSQRDTLSGGLFDDRLAGGAGVKDWGAKLNTTTGQLLYDVNLRGAPNGDNWFELSYSSSQGLFSLGGVDGFSLNLTGLTGAGEFVAFLGSSPGDNIKIPLTGPSLLFYPLSNIITYGSLDDLYQLEFRFIPKSADFSITLDEITMIPEPSAAALLGVGAAGLLRRGRKRPLFW